MTLKEYTAEANMIAREYCAADNKLHPKRIFKAVHNDFPEGMMQWYFDYGYTPASAAAICLGILADKGLQILKEHVSNARPQ